jgi:arylsulfatase A-like enzyme
MLTSGRIGLMLLPLLGVGWKAATAAPPNVVVILADDLGFSDLGCQGGEIDTPNLDRLAAGGLQYTQGYNTARCWPTRAALLTGYYPQSVGRDALPGGPGGVRAMRPPWAQLLPERLVAAGYRSYHSGKWHIDGEPLRQGFDRSLDLNATGQNNYFDPSGIGTVAAPERSANDFYATAAIGEHAVACLVSHAREMADRPFFQYVAFTAPHFPLQAPPELIAKYCERYRAGWDEVQRARRDRVRRLGLVTTVAAEMERDVGPPYVFPEALKTFGPGEIDRPLLWADLTNEQRAFQARKMAIHAAMVESLDHEVGRIVAQLEKMNVLDDTLLLFLSDNGATAEMMIRGEGHDPTAPPGSRATFLCLGPGWSSCANTPFRRHKTWVHEGGIATPWIVHWPRGIADRGLLRRQPVHVIDVVPTVLELAGLGLAPAVAAQPPLQGRSFVASLASATAPPAHDVLWWCHEGNRGVRVGDWKLVAEKRATWELYDLAQDRCETRDCAATEPARVVELEAAWNRVAAECRGLASAAAPLPAPSAPARRRPPNIVYIMSDDQGYGDIAALGNPVIETPHLDRLHAQSVRLTEFHASPTCAPTRAALLTGRHEFRSGVTHTIFERERLALTATTLPQMLAQAGYESGIFGKWHLGDEDDYQPGRRGFDRTFIHGGGGIGQSYRGSCGDVPGNRYVDPVIRSNGTFVKTAGYCTDIFFAEAIDWMADCRDRRKPFFCLITPNAPHEPLQCPPGSDARYLAPLKAAGLANPKQRANVARFYGMIENIDTNVGLLLQWLDDWGIADDTLVVFTTDNGTATGARVFNDGMRGLKNTVYRGGVRVPSFWRWPGVLPAGVDVKAVTAHIDVLPTLCELAGAVIPAEIAPRLEGRSLVPLLHDANASWPDRPLVTHLGRWQRGAAAASRLDHCRLDEGPWSLVNTRNKADAWELYDVDHDPGESQDVAGAHPEVVARMAQTYDRWWRSVQPDLVNEEVDGPAENPFKTASLIQSAPPAGGRQERRPNIVFFLCDDLGTGDLSCLGSKDIKTPNIDALFARGTRLSRHWAGSAVCAPSRCVLLTGKHPGHAVVRSNREAKPEGQFPMPAGTVTLAAILKDAGYATGGFGKWGLGPPGSVSDPVACGFNRFFGYNCQREAHSFYPQHFWYNREKVILDNPSLAGDPAVARGGKLAAEPPPDAAAFAKFAGKQYSADLIAEQQLAFVRAHADRPFFVYVPTTVPHLALQVPADEPSLADYETHFGAEPPYLGGRGYVPNPRPLATYAAMITRMDREVGRLVSLLDELELTDDTIFVFSSDNGATFPGLSGLDTARLKSNGALRDWKGSPYEGGLRVPTVAVWPGHIPAGREIAAPTGFEDWMPTLLDLAGLTDRLPEDVDGRSLAPALLGTTAAPEKRMLYRELTEGKWQATVDGGWKAIRRAAGPKRPAEPGPVELYDLAADPSETTNLARQRPEIVERMTAILDREHVPHPDWPLPFADPARRQGASERQESSGGPAARPPNVVVVLIDDLGYGDIGPFGAMKQQTPNLDRMAREGMKLTSFYAAPVCSVSRAQLLTGCYGLRVSVPWVFFPAERHGLNPAEVTVAERLRAEGYATACIGKWHLGDQPEFLPTRQGFDRYFGIPYSNDMQKASRETGEKVVPLLRDDHVVELLTDEAQRTIVERCTAEATAFIRTAKEQPFFLYLPHTAVHAPLFPGARFRGASDNGPFGDWVEELDWSVGQVLDTIRDEGLDEQTLVIFTSDNGPWTSVVRDDTNAGPLRGSKGSTWEGGVRVPTVARWPGRIAPGSVCDTMAGTIDLLPTFVALAGGELPADAVLDGRDITGLLDGTTTEAPREAHYYFNRTTLQAVRQGRWKLAIAPQAEGMGKKAAKEDASPEHPRLYDLEADIGERTNRAADHPEVVARLRSFAERMAAELCGPEAPGRRPAGDVPDPQLLYPSATSDPPPRNQPGAAARR